MAGDPKLINFKHFFTRKLFLLRESDAIALFPGGFGTQDEAFECMTLSQTGKFGPVPLVLIDRPGGDYWQDWSAYIHKHLVQQGLISPDDPSLYTVTNLNVVCKPSPVLPGLSLCRYVGDKLVIRLKTNLSDVDVERLNTDFSDILVKGRIEKVRLYHKKPKMNQLGYRLVLYFNQRDLGRLCPDDCRH